MLIQPTNIPIQSNLSTESTEFSIDRDSTAFIIQLLSSRMYTNAPMSMVRELVTNALDSNLEAGIPNIPISISVKRGDSNDLGIYTITDSGNGMSRDCVKNILTKLGKSTKSNSNDSHGGFGLGILSVFAVSSQATIITVADGILYHYLMFLNEKGIPAINLITQRLAASHEKGTKVEVPFNITLETQIYAAVCWFVATVDPQPLLDYTVCDRNSGSLPTVFRRDSYELRSVRNRTVNVNPLTEITCTQVLVKVGEVAYPLNDEMLCKLRSSTENVLAKDICTHSIGKDNYQYSRYTDNPACGEYFILNVPVGKLALPGSREDILNTPENLKIVKQVFDSAIEDLQFYITEYIQSPETSLNDRISISNAYRLETVIYNKYTVPTKQFYSPFGCQYVVYKNSSNRLEERMIRPADMLKTCQLYAIISNKTRGIASTILKLVGNDWDSNCFWIYKTEEEYQTALNKPGIQSLLLSKSKLLVDDIKATRAKSLSTEQKLTIKLRQLTNDGNIQFIPNIRVLTTKSDLSSYKLDDISKLSTNISIEAFVYIDSEEELLRAAYICNQLNIDVSCWLGHSKTTNSLIKMLPVDVQNLHLYTYLQPLVISRMEPRLAKVKVLNCFPLLPYSAADTYVEKGQKILEWILNNPYILEVIESSVLSALREYAAEYILWSYILHITQIKKIICNEIGKTKYNFNSNSDDGDGLISKVFSSTLRLLPSLTRWNSNFTVYIDNNQRLKDLNQTLKALVYLNAMSQEICAIDRVED